MLLLTRRYEMNNPCQIEKRVYDVHGQYNLFKFSLPAVTKAGDTLLY